jgi:FecR-like protein
MANSEPHEETRKVRAVSEFPVPSRGSTPPPAGAERASQAELAQHAASGAGARPGLLGTLREKLHGTGAPFERRSLRPMLGAGMTLLVIAGAIALWPSGKHAPPAENVPTSAAPSPVLAPSPAGRELRDGAHLLTKGAAEELRLGDSELTLAPASELRVSGNETSGWFLALDTGRIDCHVVPRPDRPPFMVIAGETRVSVLGTRFSVAQSADGTRVAVDEGNVRVESRGQVMELVSGESWVESLPPAPRRAPAQSAEAQPPRKVSKAVAHAEKRFEQAAALESSRPNAALRIYRSLRRARGPWVSRALYEEARLQLELRHPKRAKPLLELYLKRHPDGANAADARALLEPLRTKR